MVTIYSDYGDEPSDTFLPLPDHLRGELYALEMDGFTDDIDVFNRLMPHQGDILELGCGTGRLTRPFARPRRTVTGIDISPGMLLKAREKNVPHCRYIQMDMAQIAFSKQFDIIVIGYNTLNLLSKKSTIVSCLQGCCRSLRPEGRLLLQLYLPTREFIDSGKKTFQFQMFDLPGGGKVIKEILKLYSAPTRTIQVEERYRVRSLNLKRSNEDYNSTYTIAGYSLSEWHTALKEAGFVPDEIYGDYGFRPVNDGVSTMLIGSFFHSR